ncbi:hypothetical protein HK102_000695 [Quaeritorhiza haematococci]|nr:hypothetical protein HK102_000695 [Quaeritorhiza haematococci]
MRRSAYHAHSTSPGASSRARRDGTPNEDELTRLSRGPHTFYIPALKQPIHWAFYSCAGFSMSSNLDPENDFDGVRPLGRDVLRVHRERPLHYFVGVGDQIYNDDVLHSCRHIASWLDIGDRVIRESAAFTPDMRAEVERFYFFHYCVHFSQEVLGEVFACVPGVMLLDDHDVVDGYGSYPAPLQNCPVALGIGNVAARFYLLFQHHTTPELARTQDNLFGGSTGYSFLKMMSPRTAILGVDARLERTKENGVVDPETWRIVFEELLPVLPESVEHLIFIAGVPMVWPVLGLSELFFESLSKVRRTPGFRWLFWWSGLWKQLGFALGEPDLLDDLVDHWNSPYHLEERNKIVAHLQDFSFNKNVRVTFISGDVHCAGFSAFHMPRIRMSLKHRLRHPFARREARREAARFVRHEPRTLRGRDVDPRMDWRCMYQVVSSAIANEPPPKFLEYLYAYTASAAGSFGHAGSGRGVFNLREASSTDLKHSPKAYLRHEYGGRGWTEERMLKVFERDVDGKKRSRRWRRILARRNWCEVDEIVGGGEQVGDQQLRQEEVRVSEVAVGGGAGGDDGEKEEESRVKLLARFGNVSIWSPPRKLTVPKEKAVHVGVGVGGIGKRVPEQKADDISVFRLHVEVKRGNPDGLSKMYEMRVPRLGKFEVARAEGMK